LNPKQQCRAKFRNWLKEKKIDSAKNLFKLIVMYADIKQASEVQSVDF